MVLLEKVGEKVILPVAPVVMLMLMYTLVLAPVEAVELPKVLPVMVGLKSRPGLS